MSALGKTMRFARSLKARRGAAAFVTYHRVGEYAVDPDSLAITPAEFERHIAHFAAEYELLQAKDAFERVAKHEPLPRKGLVITVDDGYADMATVIAPILARYDAPATFFISSGLVAGDRTVQGVARNHGLQPGGLDCPDARTLDAEQLAQLANNHRIELGAHGHSHVQLKTLTAATLVDDVAQVTSFLEEIAGRKPISFCYPYGGPDSYDRRVVRALEASGYQGACTTMLGKHLPWGALYSSSNTYNTPRIASNGVSLEALVERINQSLAL